MATTNPGQKKQKKKPGLFIRILRGVGIAWGVLIILAIVLVATAGDEEIATAEAPDPPRGEPEEDTTEIVSAPEPKPEPAPEPKPDPEPAKPEAPARVARPRDTPRLATVSTQFTGCFDRDELAQIFREVQGATTSGTLNAYAAKIAETDFLARRECALLEEGTTVRLIGEMGRAYISENTVVEGIHVLVCLDPACSRYDTEGFKASGLWFPVDFLQE